jgi:hypothetical protein
MHRQKVPNSGWAAFDRKWRSADGRGHGGEVDSFPVLSDFGAPNPASSSITGNNGLKPKPFASVVRPSVDLAAVSDGSRNKHSVNNVDNLNRGASAASDDKIKLLKDAHSWAESNLIEDVLAAVNNDVSQASDLLKAMVSPDLQTGDGRICGQLAAEVNKSLPSEDSRADNRKPDNSHLLLLPMNLSSIPLEPELIEFDDDYLNYRKDALRMMRYA